MGLPDPESDPGGPGARHGSLVASGGFRTARAAPNGGDLLQHGAGLTSPHQPTAARRVRGHVGRCGCRRSIGCAVRRGRWALVIVAQPGRLALRGHHRKGVSAADRSPGGRCDRSGRRRCDRGWTGGSGAEHPRRRRAHPHQRRPGIVSSPTVSAGLGPRRAFAGAGRCGRRWLGRPLRLQLSPEGTHGHAQCAGHVPTGRRPDRGGHARWSADLRSRPHPPLRGQRLGWHRRTRRARCALPQRSRHRLGGRPVDRRGVCGRRGHPAAAPALRVGTGGPVLRSQWRRQTRLVRLQRFPVARPAVVQRERRREAAVPGGCAGSAQAHEPLLDGGGFRGPEPGRSVGFHGARHAQSGPCASVDPAGWVSHGGRGSGRSTGPDPARRQHSVPAASGWLVRRDGRLGRDLRHRLVVDPRLPRRGPRRISRPAGHRRPGAGFPGSRHRRATEGLPAYRPQDRCPALPGTSAVPSPAGAAAGLPQSRRLRDGATPGDGRFGGRLGIRVRGGQPRPGPRGSRQRWRPRRGGESLQRPGRTVSQRGPGWPGIGGASGTGSQHAGDRCGFAIRLDRGFEHGADPTGPDRGRRTVFVGRCPRKDLRRTGSWFRPARGALALRAGDGP